MAMRSLRMAWAFLTRMPGGAHPVDESELRCAVPWFPVVGAAVGAMGAALYVALLETPGDVLSPFTAAALTFMVTALATGGFHEDGLADSFDALAGGRDAAHRLRILKDSRHGTFGVLALVTVTLIKVAALSDLSGWNAAAALVVAHGGGRSAAVVLMGIAPVARPDGLGADYARRLPRGVPTLAFAFGGILLAGLFGPWAGVVVAALLVTVGGVGVWAWRRIGGVTGDLLGAAEQVAECVILVSAGAL